MTRGPWWQIIVGYGPWCIYYLMISETNLLAEIIYFVLGAITVSLCEYLMHRFLFHAEHSWLPDHPKAIAIHFVGNGIHHAFP